MERTYFRREQAALTLLFYCISVIVWRGIIFYEEFIMHGIGPRVIVRGLHLHHFVLGMFFLTCAILLRLKAKEGRACLIAALTGTGLGLVLDETSLWFPPGPEGYWAAQNFIVVVAVGMVLLFRAFPLPSFLLHGRRKKRVQASEPRVAQVMHKNPDDPFITVVIPAYNEEALIGESLRSLVNQTYKNFELIVVDNNSTDRTADVARSFGAIVITQTQQGVTRARQSGFTAARGAVIATTDADTVVPMGWLARIAHEFKKDPEVVAFGGLYTLYSGPMTARLAVAYLSLPAWRMDKFLCRGWSIPGTNLSIRADAFRQIGGFNTDLKLREDVDISHRLKHVGKVVLDPTLLVSTSGRRFKNGFLRSVMTYGPNTMARMLLKKHKFAGFPTIRAESVWSRRFSFAPAFASVLLLFSMFYWSNPSIAEVRPVSVIMQNQAVVAEQLKSFGHEIRLHFIGRP